MGAECELSRRQNPTAYRHPDQLTQVRRQIANVDRVRGILEQSNPFLLRRGNLWVTAGLSAAIE
jgi:hypothetical protein